MACSYKVQGSIFAVHIGIKNYLVYDPVPGADKDAENWKAFVENDLIIPEGKSKSIKYLLDSEATRDKIVAALKWLYDPETHVNKEDLVLVTFSGHGARGAPPEGWAPRGQTGDNTIEMICPYDMTRKDASGNRKVNGVPDVILGTIITKIAEKCNNIVSLLIDLST